MWQAVEVIKEQRRTGADKMKLNTIAYGNPIDYDEQINIKTTSEGSYYDLFNTGKLPLNVINDESISWGQIQHSKLAQCIYINVAETGGTPEAQYTKIGKANPILIGYKGSISNNQFDFLYVFRYGYGATQININWKQCYPILAINTTGLIFLACVIYKTSTDIYSTIIPYDDFMNLSNKDALIVQGIAFYPFYGTETKRTVYSNLKLSFIGELDRIIIGDKTDNFPEDMLTPKAMTSGYYPAWQYENKYNNPAFSIGFAGVCQANVPYYSNLIEGIFDIETATTNNKFLYSRLKNGWHDLYLLLNAFNETGLYYCTKISTATSATLGKNCTDPDVRMGIIQDGNITGQGATGDKTTSSPLADINNADDFSNNGFGGNDSVDPNTYTDKVDLNKPTLSNVNVFNRSFAVTSNNVRQLADFLWNADETKFQEIVKGLALMGENPMNGIIDLRLFPFNVALKNSATQAESIVIGRTNTGVNGIKLTENVNSLIDLGECTFFEKFKNFLDFEPYTTAQLYIPYIGVVPVSTAEFMGHKISVKMIVDYTTGAGTAIVFKDDIPFIYRNGVVGVSIPMTGNDSASYANTVIGNVVSGAVSGVASIANGNIGGMVSSAEKLYSGFATGTNYQEASASSPSVATWQPQRCYFIIDRPILNVPDNYGRTIGYACEKTGKLSDFKGFTVVSNPEINFRCTDSERQYIVNMLQGGVFV